MPQVGGLTRVQQFVVLTRSLESIQAVERSRLWSTSFHGNFVQAHMVSLALAHFDDALKHLRSALPASATFAADQFAEVFSTAKMRDLRNLLEHELEYLVGQGKYPSLTEAQDAFPLPGEADGTWTTRRSAGRRITCSAARGRPWKPPPTPMRRSP